MLERILNLFVQTTDHAFRFLILKEERVNRGKGFPNTKS